MKNKLIIILTFLFFVFSNAQEIRGGIHGGFPIGDLGDATSFNLGLDVSGLWEVYENTKAGFASGYTHFFGKTIDLPYGGEKVEYKGVGMIPIAGTAQYNFTKDIYAGADIGLAVALRNVDIISFYFQPKVGYQINNDFDVFGSIKFISSGAVFGGGLSYKFMSN